MDNNNRMSEYFAEESRRKKMVSFVVSDEEMQKLKESADKQHTSLSGFLRGLLGLWWDYEADMEGK